MIDFLVYLVRSLGHPQWDKDVCDIWHITPKRSRTADAELHDEGESRNYAKEGERRKDEGPIDRHWYAIYIFLIIKALNVERGTSPNTHAEDEGCKNKRFEGPNGRYLSRERQTRPSSPNRRAHARYSPY